MLTINDENIDVYLYAEKPIYIFFHSTLNPAENTIKEFFESLNEKYGQKIFFGLCNYYANDCIKVRQYFKINVLPAVLLLKNNKFYGNIAGIVSKEKYEDILKEGIYKILKDEGKI